MKRRLICAALLVLAAALVAVPAVYGDTTSGPFTTTTPISYTLTDWTGSLSFAKFDSSLGALTEVDMTINGAMRTVLTVTNNSPQGSSGTAKTELQMSVQDPGANFTPPQLDFFSPNFVFNLGPNGSVTSGTLTKTASDTQVYTTAAILSEFNGPGTIVCPASTFTQTWIAYNGGNADAVQVTDGSLTGTVTYHYNPVPEPGTLGLLLAGAACLVAFGWQKRRAA
jgi:hypothetical protein